MHITSPAFEDNSKIPDTYTCKGQDINPPLKFGNIPEETESFVLIMDDPDAPVGIWVHWIMWNIPAETTHIAENSVPKGAAQGVNSWMKNSYGGPCPPSGMHRYFFKLYALNTTLDLQKDAKKNDVERAMQGHILAEAQLIGLYSKG